MLSADDDILEYFKEVEQVVPRYMDLFKMCKLSFNHYFHFIFLRSCKESSVIPNGLRLKHEPSISSNDASFFQNWRTALSNAENSLLNILIDEQQKLFLASQNKFWHVLHDSMTKCKKHEDFVNWWLKLYAYQEKYVRKLKVKKLKKIRKLIGKPGYNFSIEACQFSEDLSLFAESLPEDAAIIGTLLTLDDSSDSVGPINSPIGSPGNSNEPQVAEKSFETTSCDLKDDRLIGKFVSPNVVNLSQRNLTETEISLLSKGLNFVPTPKEVNISEIKADLEAFGRKLRLKWHFRDNTTVVAYNPFKPKSTFNPFRNDPTIEVYLSMLEEEIVNLTKQENSDSFDNLTKAEKEALRNLSADKSIIIKGADKGSAVVVWDRLDYLKEANSQLDDSLVYERTTADPLPSLNEIIKSALSKIRERRELPLETMEYFTVKRPKLGRFYLLPKIHKRMDSIPGRPVISNNGYSTENISAFLDFHLQPLCKKVNSYIKDTNDFLLKLKTLPSLPENAILCTVDVVGLYPNIPNNEGLQALRHALDERETKTISTDTLVELSDTVLNNNFFEFDGKIYRQKRGTAIGTKMAPSYAILFMDKFERDFLGKTELKPYVWWRYIDDIFMVWEHGEEALKEFLQKLNSTHPSMKFTWKYSSETIDFLDVQVSLSEGSLITDLYVKPTDTHQYLHASSCHVYHSKKSIPYSQALRLNRICSNNSLFDKRCNQLEDWLCKRGYSNKMVRNQILAARKFSREDILNKEKQPRKDILTFNITYHPKLRVIKDTLKKLQMLLEYDSGHKKVFSDIPMVGFRKGKSLKDLLVRAKLPLLDDVPGCNKCQKTGRKGPPCQVCKLMEVSTTFTDREGSRMYDIRKGPLDCNSAYVVYLIQCKICNKQNCGSTLNKFRIRLNNYKTKFKKYQEGMCNGTLDKGSIVQQASFHKHFCQENHNGISDWSIKLIDQADDERSLRIKESFWQHKLNTFVPNGLNEREVFIP